MTDHYNYKQKFTLRQTVYKWWCIIYKPAYKLFHHGEWPAEKEPYYIKGQDSFDKRQAEQNRLAEEITRNLASSMQNDVDSIIHNVEIEEEKAVEKNKTEKKEAKEQKTEEQKIEEQKTEEQNTDAKNIDTKNIDANVLARANEIMERLAREAADDEAKKQQEIAEAKRQAEEKARLDSIMNANKVDISQYIEQGKQNQILAAEGHLNEA